MKYKYFQIYRGGGSKSPGVRDESRQRGVMNG